jgi:hypothetical protein
MRIRSLSTRLAAVAIVALWAAACGDSNPGPMAPSALPAVGTPPGPASGASIAGTVTGASASSGVRTMAGPMTVSVSGTSISSPVDDRGRFELTGVPEGTVDLRFTSGSDDATLSIGEVRRDDSIEVTVSVSGSSVVLLGMSRNGASEIELKGRIDAVDPSGRSVLVMGRTVLVTDATEITKSSVRRTFEDLGIGQDVEVKGSAQGDLVVANRIEIEDGSVAGQPVPPAAGAAEVELRGNVADLSGGCPSLQFSIGSNRVRTTGATSFERVACSAVANGLFVEVEGGRDASGVVTARTVKREDAPGTVETEAEFLGTVSGIAGVAPDLSLTVGGRTVRTSAATVVRRSGNEVGQGALAVGQLLEVKGIVRGDGTIDATRLTIEDEGAETEVEFSGTLTSIGGTVPSLSLVVGGRQVTTSSETVVRRSGEPVGFGALAVGQRLEVKGRAQGAVVTATRLTIED